MPSSFSSRLTYYLRTSRRAPGRAAEMASAAWNLIIVFQRWPVHIHVVGGDRLEHWFALAALTEEIEAELEVRSLQVAIDRLADVVNEGRAGGACAGSEPELPSP